MADTTEDSTTADGARPLRRDAARNRSLLIQAARRVFAERGLEATLDDIAKDAGVGVGTAYRHFANKYELAEAIFAEAVDRLVAQAEAARTAADPWEGLVGFMEGTTSAQTADRGLREVLMGLHEARRTQDVHGRITPAIQELVDRAKRSGAIRDDVNSTDVGMAVVMLCAVADVMGETDPQLWRRYLPMLTEGLRSSTTPPPVAATSEEAFHEAMIALNERLIRSGR